MEKKIWTAKKIAIGACLGVVVWIILAILFKAIVPWSSTRSFEGWLTESGELAIAAFLSVLIVYFPLKRWGK